MNIKDIARLADVSVSTVSKIINGKAESISKETQEKVLRIVKECRYAPYSGVRTNNSARSFLIGVLISGLDTQSEFLSSVLECTRKLGYGAVVCASRTAEEEYKNLSMQLNHQVDGIIWDRLADCDPHCLQLVEASGIPMAVIDSHAPPSPDNAFFDYRELGYAAAEALIKSKHKKLLCLLDGKDLKNELFRAGFQQCGFDNNIPAANLLAKEADAQADALIPFEVTGVVSINSALANAAAAEARRTNRRIPKYLSLVALENGEEVHGISAIRLPYRALGEHLCACVVAKIENSLEKPGDFHPPFAVNSMESINVPIHWRNKKIVVMGAMNVDVLMASERLPRMGETLRAKAWLTTLGGKGLNQAVCAARLGAEVCMIGKTGKDYDGGNLFHFLRQNEVNTEGVFSTAKADSGHAYIHVQADGESSIVIHDGANNHLTCEEINSKAHLFENAGFCLMQTEMRQELVAHAAQLAVEHGCRVILKPSAVEALEPGLLKNIHILLPNEQEMKLICPVEGTHEEMARYFLNRGVNTVIITLGGKGGYYQTETSAGYFPAARFTPVDTTGAADVFSATLAVYLSQRYDLESAVQYATVAAGYSTTHYGAAPSFDIDAKMLAFLTSEQFTN